MSGLPSHECKEVRPTPKVSSPGATVTLLLLALGPSVNVPGPGRFRLAAELSGEVVSESPASEIDVGVVVCGGGDTALPVRIDRILVDGDEWIR